MAITVDMVIPFRLVESHCILELVVLVVLCLALRISLLSHL
ncbi:hypothetical protein PF010_g30138 [Phytophthora fragariae]|uniref:Uncharacterized protein n=1 Tax=Phytophthora fragariae TaxID=53985 RepID=A0A6A3PGH0_9STRA|nr:hypothetical protein PF009_g29371 [Phytophthora fragariae]KAE9054297.1 hypothetical protein PF007_g32673 [Phytophthora fragariae]KAE9060640.1 hypothetical protein PF010_g30138 [Phytophthora fragariae]KAE9156496.1 hypothetical protein PF004_g32570 [Phytophthora fragariae]KAE9267077.1 hypothetical protein PF001_g30228 [Phytophthora fragariae]